MLSVVVWHWRGERQYTPDQINALARQFHRRLPITFICITDEPEGLSSDVEVMPTPKAAKKVDVKSPEGDKFPSCYRRLWTFSDEALCLGERVLVSDIDNLVCGDIRPLIDRVEDFVGWRPDFHWGVAQRFSGALYLLRTGTRTQVWDGFDPKRSPNVARKAGYRGSDQAWISYLLADKEAYWTSQDGIYGSQDKIERLKKLPDNARIVQFNGRAKKPWNTEWARPYYEV